MDKATVVFQADVAAQTKATPFFTILKKDPVDLLLAPTSTEDRILKLAGVACGCAYDVSVKGIIGAGHLDVDAVAAKVAEIRRLMPLPIGVGFGIKGAETAGCVASVADAVIVGSAIVGRIEQLTEAPERIPELIGAFIAELRAGVDGAAL